MRSARGGGGLRRPGKSASRLAWRLAAGSAAAMLLAPSGAVAQDAGAPAISIPPSITANAATTAVLPIAVGPAGAIPARSFISVRGLPPAVALQDAHAVGPGAWAVPLSVLPAMSAIIPAGVSGQSEIVVSLIATDGQLLAQGRSMLVIQPGSTSAPAAGPAATAPAAEAAEDPDQARARAERLHSRGEAFLANGNIMGARDFFERAADAGLAASALRLAATYDPDVLARLQVQGVAPDLALARKWYARAGELGSKEAAERLKQIASE